MVMAALMLTVLLAFSALSIDIGLHHYLGAKLQNATDAAALAVGTMLDADESEQYSTAYEYLAKNGYDNKGKYQDKINVKIDYKGEAPEESAASIDEYDQYIAKGYIRMVVDVQDSTLFANILGIDSLRLRKVAYVQIQPNYESMPEALKYSIFAGARMGDLDSGADNSGETKTYIDDDNPAMDIQGSTGAGSGETAFSSVVAVAENTINGVNDFVQNLKGWMNNTFGTSFTTDYNKLVNINVSEAVMNNDSHSNANILIGVQALNAARTKDNDYTGNAPSADTDANYSFNTSDEYNGKTDAEDYGAVSFTAVDRITFGYSLYAQQRATNFVGRALENYLNNQPDKTRVYTQNVLNVQAIQHAINIMNEMDLDASTSSSFAGAYNDNAGDFELAAKRYFRVNSKVSTVIQNKVLQMEPDLVFNGTDKTITLNNQEALVYRINQKVAGEYLDEYAAIEVDPNADAQEQRLSRLQQLTGQIAQAGYDKLYEDNQPSNGLLYAGYADTSGGAIDHEDVLLERYENSQHRHVDKFDDDAHLKYTYRLKVNGAKGNRNMDNVETYHDRFSVADLKSTRLGAKHALVRTFQEKSRYISMPNLRPYFVRQINQSVRDATKKRGQLGDGVTTGDKNVKLAVKSANDGLDEVLDEVTYTDSTYQDENKFTNEYADSLLFKDFKASSSSGLTTLGDEEQTLGGVQMSNHSYKGYELYDNGTLKKAVDFVNQYDNWNKGNNWFGHNAVNAYATDTVNGVGNDYNAVSKKHTEIYQEYNSSFTNNSSFAAKKKSIEEVINGLNKPQIQDIGDTTPEEQEQLDADRPVEIATPTNPLANNETLHTPEKYFLGGGGRLNVRGGTGSVRANFNTVMTENQTVAADAFTPVTDAQAKPASLAPSYTAATVTFPTAYNTAISSLPGAPSLPTLNGGTSYSGKGSYDWGNITLSNNTHYGSISSPYTGSNWNHWSDVYASIIVPASSTVYIKNNVDLMKEGKSLDIGSNSTVYIGGNIDINNGGTGHVDFREGSKTYTGGFIYVHGGADYNQRRLYKKTLVHVTNFFEYDAMLDIGEENASAADKAVLKVGGVTKLNKGDVTNAGVKAAGNISVWHNSEMYVNGNVYTTGGDGYMNIQQNAIVVINGDLNLNVKNNQSYGLNVASGAKLYVTGNINVYDEKINNDGTIVCGGTINAEKGDIVNNGTMYASAISVGSGETRWLYNNGTLKTTGNVTVNGQFLNNSAKSNITVEAVIGGNLSTKDVIYNNPGNTSGYTATMRVNGTISTNNKAIYNNYDNNSSGSVAYLYCGGITDNCGALYNYQKGEIYANGDLNPTNIYNKANSKIKTNGSIATTEINSDGGSVVTAVQNITASKVSMYGSQFGCGGDFTISGDCNSSCAITVGGKIKGKSASANDMGVFNCPGIICKESITAKSITVTGSVRTTSFIALAGDLSIGGSSSVTVTNGYVSAANITNNNSLLVNGDLTLSGKLTNKKYLLCKGNIRTTGDTDNGENTEAGRTASIHCFGNMTVGGHLDNYGLIYLGTYENGALVDGYGCLSVDGNNGTDSISCFGSIYACGSIETGYSNYIDGANLYTLGHFIACKTGGTTLMYVVGRSNIYIRGMLTTADSQSANKVIHLDYANGSWGSVLSVLGHGAAANADCFNNKLAVLKNQQQGSNIYLGTNLYLAGTGSYTSASSKDDVLYNSGRLYVNGSINAPNAKCMTLDGDSESYDTDINVPFTDSQGNAMTYSYKGMTYCSDVFNAPDCTVLMGSYHLLYVDDPYVENDKPGKSNIVVKSVRMSGHSVLFSPNTATITEDLILQGSSIVNIRKKVSTTPTFDDNFDGSVYAPITVDLTGAPLSNISTNIVFNTDKIASSLKGTNVRVKVKGSLAINGDINLKNAVLIVDGSLTCHSLTMNHSNLWVKGTVSVKDSSNVGGAVNVTNNSLVRVDRNIVKAGDISVDKSTVFATDGIAGATSISLDHRGQIWTRDDNLNTHDDVVTLTGAVTLAGQSELFVNGNLNMNGALTVDDYSKVYGYSGIVFTSGNTISIDRTTHGTNNSQVFCGDNTTDAVKYNLQIDGTLYLPGGNKHFGKDASTYPTVDIYDNGVVICDSRISSNWIQVGHSAAANGKATLYCAGLVALKDNATYTNYGKLYAYGGTDIGNARRAGGDNDYDFNLLQDGCETFFGAIYNNGTQQTTYTSAGYYTSRGIAYIDANLNITGKTTNSSYKVGNRDTGLYMPAGAVTYISGSATFNTGNATRIEETGGFVTDKDFNVSSTIWNFGKLHIFGAFNLNSDNEWATDNNNSKKEPWKGWSLKNGSDWDNGGTNASFLAYNYGNVGGLMRFKGYCKNSGKLYMNYGLSVEGYTTQDGVAKDYAFVNFAGGNAQFAGEFRCNGNRFFNRWNTSFGCDGRLSYGEIAFNCGQMYVGGDLLNGYNAEFSTRTPSDYRDNAVGFLNMGGSDSRSFSFMNGAYKVNGDTTSNTAAHTWSDATLFVGGNMQIGNYESEHKAGTVLNVGTMYTRGNLKIYSYGGDENINTGPSFYQTSLMAYNGSNTFIGGECYSGSAAVTGKNTIFMVDGDLRVRRPLKVNMWFRFYNAGGTAGNVLSYFEDGQYKGKGWLDSGDDGFRSCYMRVGGNVYANVEGRDLENWAATSFAGDVVPYDHSRDIDIQANANILIEGSFYCPQKLYLKENVSLTVCGKGESLYDNNGNLNWKCRALDELSDQKNNPLAFGPDITGVLKGNLQNLENRLTGERCALFAYMLLDMNICSDLVVHGNAFVRDTCKIRDMTKTYIYGDLIARNYLEVGKSLDDDYEDATQARLEKYKAPGENDQNYVFTNAGYMYVAGNLTTDKYTKIYASTSVRVGGDMRTGNITGNAYVTLRHDARLFVGGDLRAQSSIDCGAYSELYVQGDCTAFSSNVKLRDQMNCYIGGNLSAATYLELGKYDDNFYRGVKSTRVQQYLNAAGDTATRPDNNGSGNDLSEGGEFSYNGDEHEVGNNDSAAEAGDDNHAEGETSASGDTTAMNDAVELGKDDTDLAVGGEYYVGGNIISLSKYIREYAYSRVVSGGYVLAVQHITLRHNADMWVLPEVFGKTTYHTTVYQNIDDWDANLWNKIKNQVLKIAHDLKEDFEPKAGSIYSLGQLTMNKNTSIFGTYDTMVFGQTVLRKASLIFVGHDFDCWAPVYNLQSDFSSFGAFMDSMKANLGLSESKTYKGFDSFDETQNTSNPKPIVIYANNEINVATTARIRSTYFIANRGNVNFTNLNFASETSEVTSNDAKSLPNAFVSYQGDVNFYALRGTLGALMYAPVGNIDLDGFAYNFYGSMVGHTVDINTFYINVHRYNNWRTMDLHIASSKNVYLVSQDDYDNAKDDVDDLYLYGYDTNPDPNINEWAQPFFPGLPKNSTDTGSSSGEGGGYDDGFNTP